MKPNLPALVALWQERLRLRDWRLTVSYEPNLAAGDGSPCYGLCSPFVDAKEARIYLRDPDESNDGIPPHDVEETLVHELLHLHFAPLAENTSAGVAAEEQAVWAITSAISQMKDLGARARLARAVALVAEKARRVPRKTERAQKMDPVVLAALKAALTAEDPVAAVQALITELEGETQAGDAPTTDADGQPLEQRAASAEADADKPETKAARGKANAAAVRAALAEFLGAPAAAPAVRTASVPMSQLATKRDVDMLRIERLLDARPDLTEAQRSFALGVSYDAAQRFVKVTPVNATEGAHQTSTRAAGVAPVRAQLANRPVTGARGVKPTTEDAILAEVDRRMGVSNETAPTVHRNEQTGRLTISAVRPMRVGVSAEGGK